MNAEFEKYLTHLINRHSIENEVDMPDFLLARSVRRSLLLGDACGK